MALIVCPECKREISDRAPACPHCGFPIHAQDASSTDSSSKTLQITVTMSKQTFLMSATVTVILNGQEVAWVGDGQTATFPAPVGENTVLLKANMRKRELKFTAFQDVTISAKWNRLSGGIDALCTGQDIRMA